MSKNVGFATKLDYFCKTTIFNLHMAKKKTAPKTKQVVPAVAALVIAALVLLGVALTAARVGSDNAVAPTAPESEAEAAGRNRIGDPAKRVKQIEKSPKAAPKPTFLAR